MTEIKFQDRPFLPKRRWRRRFFSPRTLHAQIMLAIGALQLILFAVFAVYAGFEQIKQTVDERQRLGDALLSQLADSIAPLLIARGESEVRGLGHRMSGRAEIALFEVRGPDGALLFRRAKPLRPMHPFVARWVASDRTGMPIYRNIDWRGETVGSIKLGLTNGALNEQIDEILWKTGCGFLTLLILNLLASRVLIRHFVAPLGPLTMMATELTQGQWPTTVKPPEGAPEELQHLSQAFLSNANVMRKQIGELERTRWKLAEREMRLRSLLNTMREVLIEMDARGHILFLNPAWETLTGLAIAPCLNKPFQMFLTQPEQRTLFNSGRLSLLHGRDLELELRAPDGNPIWVQMHVSVRYRRNGELSNVVATMYDVSEQRELEQVRRQHAEDLYQLTITDPLTGVFNRRHFDHVLGHLLSTRLAAGTQIALLIIDLDGFKFINDTYGHPVGDEVLKAVAQALMREPASHDLVARLAGDEFAIILEGTEADFQHRSQEIHAKLSQIKIPLAVGQLKVQSSIGLAFAPMHGKTPQDLVRAADVALYHAKRSGRNRVDILSKDRGAAIMDIFSQGFELRNALATGAISPFLQPIVDVATRKIVAYEVLMRMKRDNIHVAADKFVRAAEELGLIREMDLYIIRQALLHVPNDIHLFLNISLSSFYTPEFSRELKKLLLSPSAQGRALTLEFTERQTTDMSADFTRLVNDLRAGGCKIALDDFGAGYSTYSYLRRLKPDFVKIDGSFVQQVLKNPQDAKIVQHINELSEVFGAQSIAEHVEDEATVQLLERMGVGLAQGYLFGHPRPMHECVDVRGVCYG